MNPNSGCLISLLACIAFWIGLFIWSWKIASALVVLCAVGMVVIALSSKEPIRDDSREYEEQRFI